MHSIVSHHGNVLKRCRWSLINLIFAYFWILFLPAQEQSILRVGAVLPNTPAAAAQMHVGDKIVAIDGTQASTWEKLNYAIVDRVVKPSILMSAERNGQLKTFQGITNTSLKTQKTISF